MRKIIFSYWLSVWLAFLLCCSSCTLSGCDCGLCGRRVEAASYNPHTICITYIRILIILLKFCRMLLLYLHVPLHVLMALVLVFYRLISNRPDNWQQYHFEAIDSFDRQQLSDVKIYRQTNSLVRWTTEQRQRPLKTGLSRFKFISCSLIRWTKLYVSRYLLPLKLMGYH